jgi:hypothetical protein
MHSRRAPLAPKLSDDQRRALEEQSGSPVKVEDEQTRQVYILVAQEEFARMANDELRRELQVGFDQAERGQMTDWNPEEIKTEGRRRISRDPSQA